MKVVSTEVNGLTLLVELTEHEATGKASGDRETMPTGKLSNKLAVGLSDAFSMVQAIAQDAKQIAESIFTDSDLASFEIEFGISFSAESGICIMTTKAEGTLKATLQWRRS